MLIYPTLHYQNGGISINSECETSTPGLYCAGEVTGGVHGSNRLMGNSLLDVLVFGRRAGSEAYKYAKKARKERSKIKLSLKHVKKFHDQLEKAGIKNGRVAPMVLPDYTPDEVKKRQWV
jgi:succinate dehydrogenase/fumarate reductase flavoprotein subunit